MHYKNLKISIEEAEKILRDLFEIHGTAQQLPGEIDFNFRIKTEGSEGYILKISRPDENIHYLDFQQKLLQYIAENSKDVLAPRVIKNKDGEIISEITDAQGNVRKVRLLTWVSGRIWDDVHPQTDELRRSLGEQCGRLTAALQGFDHAQAHRIFVWDVAQSLWTTEFIHLFKGEEKEIIQYFQQLFEAKTNTYSTLRSAIVHNDANCHNVIVSPELVNPKVMAAIDYGDAINTQIINDVAIAAAYASMGQEEPLEAILPFVKGYHSTFPLEESELEHLYAAIAMRLVITATKSAINKEKEPDNEYLLISEKPAWEVLKKWRAIDADFAHYAFRHACGLEPHPNRNQFDNWAKTQKISLKKLFPTLLKEEVYHIDLSVSSTFLGHQNDFNDLDRFQFNIDQLQKEEQNKIIAGGYLEPRAVYTSSAYDKIGNSGRESRTIHLGIDYWLAGGTPVASLFDGEIVTAVNDSGDKEYGGLIIIKHHEAGFDFYSLYGHLNVNSVLKHKTGDVIKAGDQIAVLGDYPENGNWAPHLHFQLMLSLLNYSDDFPGVAYHNQIERWASVCPDPNSLFKCTELEENDMVSNNELIAYRKKHLGKSLSLQYKTPIKMVRGSGVYLIDQFGRKYMDTVNNVAHVGHEHYNVVKAGKDQMSLLNTNSRYLHENISKLAKELLETLPPELHVLHFVNSGSEANELAIRMVKAATGSKDIIASEVGYHGNSNMCIDISSYKFDGKGGKGAPEHTHIFPLPDAFRGKYRGTNTADHYVNEVKQCIENIHSKGRTLGAMILEPIISCGGQIELPDGFLAKAYKAVRNAGGLCISDEVQVGCGRVGKTFWGFQLHDVIPDIVTIGKPLGNGHPLAAVACTREVADAFANGMEYFNTFGGNPVSCAIGTAVLRTVKTEKLQENAFKTGEFLKQELQKLAVSFPIIGDVRGQGLFLGIELVDSNLNPLPEQTDYIANRMKNYGILMSTDGPDNNVLKIKPPMVFNKENAKELLFYLKKVLQEDFIQGTK